MSLNTDLADIFATIADIMDLRGENPFKGITYRKISRILRDSPLDIRQAVENGTIGDIEGIGEHSRSIIEEYVRTGRSTEYETLCRSVPAGVLALLEVEGLGPKTVARFWKERNITSADQLLTAIDDGSLLDMKGIGQKKLAAIRQGLLARAKTAGRRGIGEVLPVAQELLRRLRRVEPVRSAEVAGSLRRMKETIGDVDLLACVAEETEAPVVTRAFVEFPGVERVLGQGDTKASIVVGSGLQIDLRVLPERHFGAALMYFTGSKDHNVRVRGLAQKKGMTLNEWGLYDAAEYARATKKTGAAPPIEPLASRTEHEIFARLGLPFIEPELREDRGEVEAAVEGRLPRIVARADLRGDLHTHTTASDGQNTIEEMAEAARAAGYEYLAITDHSKSQTIANGLDARRLAKHAEAIRKLNDRLRGITLLAGAEVDILSDGRLDYEDAVLAELDIMVASPHFALKQEQRKATDRLLRAIENPYVNIIGHPTGRLIGGREGLPLDMPAIFRAAAASGTALEINSSYPRLDLDEVNSRAAAEAGVMLAINTDAHSAGELEAISFGLAVARRAWVTPARVINCMPLAGLRAFLKKKK